MGSGFGQARSVVTVTCSRGGRKVSGDRVEQTLGAQPTHERCRCAERSCDDDLKRVSEKIARASRQDRLTQLMAFSTPFSALIFSPTLAAASRMTTSVVALTRALASSLECSEPTLSPTPSLVIRSAPAWQNACQHTRIDRA